MQERFERPTSWKSARPEGTSVRWRRSGLRCWAGSLRILVGKGTLLLSSEHVPLVVVGPLRVESLSRLLVAVAVGQEFSTCWNR